MKKPVLSILSAILFLNCQAQNPLSEGFVYLDKIVPGIEVELRYFSSNNFIGDTINGYQNNRCIISKPAALALKKVQGSLKKEGLGLKIFDAYRPQRAVDHFVKWAKDLDDTRMKNRYYPEVPKSELFQRGYIAARSGHSRGSTVDLTIIHETGENKGRELDMGTPWDLFSPDSWPSSNAVTKRQRRNRMKLQTMMIKNGFRPLKKEWWHFSLNDEPFPGTYFDFVIE